MLSGQYDFGAGDGSVQDPLRAGLHVVDPDPVAAVAGVAEHEQLLGLPAAMAAAAANQLFGGSPSQIEYAAEMGLEHHLGMTCDPVCGLVQIPCIERNAVAAKRAIDSANLAHMLVGTRTISFDMVVRTMYETGISMTRAFRETSEGGLARLYSRRAGTAPTRKYYKSYKID